MIITDPLFYFLAVPAVIILGLAKGGFAGVGTASTPLLALYLPPLEAAALMLPLLLMQDAISVWWYRHDWDAWNLRVLLPGGGNGGTAALDGAEGADRSPPLLELEQVTPYGNIFIVRGRTEAGSTVEIAGEPASVAADGSFTKTIQLNQEGWSSIEVRARDAWGNPVSATATVRDEVYYPAPAYQAPPTVVTTAPAPSTVYYDAYGRPVAVAPGTVLYYPAR